MAKRMQRQGPQTIEQRIEEAQRAVIDASYRQFMALADLLKVVKAMSDQEFTALIANVCPSERQNFRVSLIDFLSLQFPKQDADANLSTANRAIELAQKDIVIAFVRRRAAAK